MHRHHANSHAIEAPPCRLHRRRPYRPLPAAGPARRECGQTVGGVRASRPPRRSSRRAQG